MSFSKRKTGPKPKLSREDAAKLVQEHRDGNITVEQIVIKYGISKGTLYKELRRAA